MRKLVLLLATLLSASFSAAQVPSGDIKAEQMICYTSTGVPEFVNSSSFSGTYDSSALQSGFLAYSAPVSIDSVGVRHYLLCDSTGQLLVAGGGSTGVISVNGRTNIVTLTSADVNLSNVNNTADADKPVSTATASAIATVAAQETSDFALTVKTAQRAVANGIATLDATGALTTSQIPASLFSGLKWQGTWNASTNSPALTAGTAPLPTTVSGAQYAGMDGTTVGSAQLSAGTFDSIAASVVPLTSTQVGIFVGGYSNTATTYITHNASLWSDTVFGFTIGNNARISFTAAIPIN